jgi:AraC-like DNA-binding protein
MSQGAWGERLARSFHLDAPPTVLARTAGGRVLAATELRRDEPLDAMSAPLGEDDAYLVGLQLRGLRRHELWLDGRPLETRSPAAGTSCIFDLKRNPVAWLGEPFHTLQFYMPCAALSEVVGASRRQAVNDLTYEAGAFMADPVIESLGRCLLPMMRSGGHVNQLFVDYVLLALREHLVDAYGGARCVKAVELLDPGGLAPWQQRRATELIRAHVVDGIALGDLAKACRLSSSTFVRAFKKSMGVPPHQWLLLRRVDRAIELMRDHSLLLADIALSAGFSDQSHFTRVFVHKMGVSPGAWRSALSH